MTLLPNKRPVIVMLLGALALPVALAGCDRGVTEAVPPDPATVPIEHEPSPLKRLTAHQYAIDYRIR